MGKIIYKLDENYFEKIDSEEKAYWLGFIYADGCNTRNQLVITLNKKDRELLVKFKKCLKSNLRITNTSTNLNGKTFYQSTIRISRKKICNDLTNHGAIPAKSLVLTFPEWLDQKYIRHFIRGYFDGDGSLIKNNLKNKKHHAWHFHLMGTENFCRFVQTFFENNFRVHVIVSKDRKLTTVRLSKRSSVKSILDYLYGDASIYLKRKYLRYLELKKEYIPKPRKPNKLFNDKQIEEIRNSKFGSRVLSKMYNCGRTTIRSIKNRINYK